METKEEGGTTESGRWKIGGGEEGSIMRNAKREESNWEEEGVEGGEGGVKGFWLLIILLVYHFCDEYNTHCLLCCSYILKYGGLWD